MTEVLVYPPKVWSYNWPDGDPRHGKVGRYKPYDCYEKAVAENAPGDILVAYAAAPGTGHVKHRITRIDETGVYGVEIENTMRILDPSEVI